MCYLATVAATVPVVAAAITATAATVTTAVDKKPSGRYDH
jgi:hypothetical protein